MKIILLQPVKLSADITPPGETVEVDDAVAGELISIGAASRESQEASTAARDELRRTSTIATHIGQAAAEAASPQPESRRRKTARHSHDYLP